MAEAGGATIRFVELRQLESFVRVAELGSFSRAAQLLRVAQPALSRQVRALEVELRQVLFERHGRGVRVTPAGQVLLAHAQGLLQQAARARQALEELRGAAVGRLAIGLPPSVGRLVGVPLVQACRQRFPQATLTLMEGLSTTLLGWLQQGRVDLVVAYHAEPSAAWRLEPVCEEPLVVVSSRGRSEPAGAVQDPPLSLAALASRALVIPSRPNAIRVRLDSAMAAEGLAPHIALEVESVPAMLDLVEQSAGSAPEERLHAVLARHAVRDREATLALQPLRTATGAGLSTTVWIATSTQRPRGPLLEQGSLLLRGLLAQASGRTEGGLAGSGPALSAAPAESPRPAGSLRH